MSFADGGVPACSGIQSYSPVPVERMSVDELGNIRNSDSFPLLVHEVRQGCIEEDAASSVPELGSTRL